MHEIVLDLLTISLPEEPATAGSVVDGSAVRQSRRRRSLGEDSSSWAVRATLRRGSSRRFWQPPDYGGLVEEATLTAVVVERKRRAAVRCS